MDKQASILVISYNTVEDTLECLQSVFEQTERTTFELIVFDNQSSDGSADAIEAKFGDRLRLIRSEENLGFAMGNNEAMKFATGEYLILLNPDTIVLDHAIDRLMDFARKTPDAKIWGGRSIYADGTLNSKSCWRRQTLWGLTMQAFGLSSAFRNSTFFNPEAMGGWDRSTEREVDIITGAFLLIRRDFWSQLGGFSRDYFMYGEEADLCLRARDLGARPRSTPTSTIIHHGGRSEKVRADMMVRLLRSKLLLIKQHFPRGTRSLGKALLSLWPFSRWFVHATLAKLGRASSRDAARNWGEIWQRRSEWASGT